MNTKTGTSRYRVAVQVIAGLLLVSCSTGQHDEASPAPGQTGGQPDVEQGWQALPVQGLAYRTPLNVLVNAAESEIANGQAAQLDCMESKGFGEISSESGSGASYVLSNMLRPSHDDEADVRGLNLVARIDAQASGPIPQSTANYDPTSVLAAVEECSVEIGDREEVTAMTALVDSYKSEVLQTPLVQAATGEWAECMKGAGYDVANVRDLADLVLPATDASNALFTTEAERSVWAEAFFPVERDAGLAVVTCDRTSIFPVLDDWASIENDWSAAHADELGGLSSDDRLLLSLRIAI